MSEHSNPIWPPTQNYLTVEWLLSQDSVCHRKRKILLLAEQGKIFSQRLWNLGLHSEEAKLLIQSRSKRKVMFLGDLNLHYKILDYWGKILKMILEQFAQNIVNK